ncbi:hypothetical protein QQS21_003404 [Conoideocrella luteorostrata]|uniref:MARVEL domain-containing protein n=1 Tax=Conoideocrella luteorostrata TaxID=1105319 RepID=A0AAJ0CUC8_9HYPO|nr:hypothetical protein QQS21_003404 [Conoideocrella luteorostrata]
MQQARILRTVVFILRALQFASATVVTGVTGYFLYKSDASPWDLGRFIYTEVVASVSMLAVISTILPFVDAFVQIPLDIVLSLLWWAVFGLLFNFLQFPCEWVFEWMNIAPFDQQCAKLNADAAFAFICAVFFMVSGILNVLIDRRQERQEESDVRKHYLKREMAQTKAETQV